MSAVLCVLCTFCFVIQSTLTSVHHMTMFMSQKSGMTVVAVILYPTIAALVNAANDADVRPSDEPSECLCKFPKHNQPNRELLKDLEPLCGKR